MHLLHPHPPCTAVVLQVPAPTVKLHINITQPLMNQTGQLRWALNNIASQLPTPCEPLLDLVYK
jgi:L-ascorbate oxidase